MKIDLKLDRNNKTPIDLNLGKKIPHELRGVSLEDIANSPGINSILGSGDAIRNLLSLGMTSGSPSSSGTAYNISKIGGDIAGFMGGGEILDTARAGLEGGSHLIGMIARALSKPGMGQVAKRAIGSSAYGAATSPEDRIKGAEVGAITSPAIDLIGASGKNLFNSFRPESYAKKLVDKISGGLSLKENARLVAKIIKNNFLKAEEEAKKIYGPIFNNNNLGIRNIYRKVNPSGIHEYTIRPEIYIPDPDSYLKKLINLFKKDPSLQNSHNLQSYLGSEIRNNKGLTTPDRNLKTAYTIARKQIKSDIHDFLKRTDPKLLSEYKKATNFYVENLSHYLDNNQIKEFIKSKSTRFNINKVFRNPEEDLSKILEDGGEELRDRILYSLLGKGKNKIDAKYLVSKTENIENKIGGLGHDSYLTDSTAKQIKSLSNKINNKKIIEYIASLFSGNEISKLAGNSASSAVAGVVGALKTPEFIHRVQEILPNANIDEAISNALRNIMNSSSKVGSQEIYKNYSR